MNEHRSLTVAGASFSPYTLVLLLVSLPLSWFLVTYLRLSTTPTLLLPAAFLIFLAQHRGIHEVSTQKKHLIWYLFFSVLLALCLVFSRHIQLDLTYVQGIANGNAFLPLTTMDAVAILVLIYLSCLFLICLFAFLPRRSATQKHPDSHPVTGIRTSQIKWMFALAAILVLAWLPYFLVYYPGLIYGDSMNSVSQAMHVSPYSNHFPLFYTLFVELCLKIGIALADITLGCAIYTIFQMISLGLLLAYLLCWLYNKGISKPVCAFFLVMFCVVRCFPQHAVSMWKDPIFSAVLMFYGLKLFDLLVSEGALATKWSFLIQTLAAIVVICLSRNNGVYIVAFCLAFLFAIALWRKALRSYRRVLVLHLASILCILVLTGPVYDALQIGKDDIESFGIPLQQLARTVAYEGNISEEDLAYLDRLLPLESWQELYKPGLVDSIKWDTSFDTAYFNETKGQFMAVWFRTLLKNPIRYIEAWCLSTYGYWSPSLWELNDYSDNIVAGNPYVLDSWWVDLGIEQTNLTGNDRLMSVFSLSTPMPATGLLTWLTMFVALYAFVRGGNRFCLLLAPAIGNFGTLLIASPSAYWPRYALVYLYMLPVLLVFPQLVDSLSTLSHTVPHDRRNKRQ